MRVLVCCLLAALTLPAQSVSAYIQSRHEAWTRAFASLLAIPNLAGDTANIERNAAAIEQLYQAQGVKTQLLRLAGAPPVVFGTYDVSGATRTVTFYAHYDGQPTHPADWAIPPFQPQIHDGRIWARSAGDDKAAVFGFVAALEALRAARLQPRANLHFFLEGEEEAGSPHLGAYLRKYAPLLRTDAWIICDGPVHQSGTMQVFFGARGVTDADLTVYGPSHALHDGHYGNWAPNPNAMLTRLLAAMRDDNGHILIPGFYDDVKPLGPSERAAIAALPPYDATLERALGLDRTEGAPQSLAERIARPALNLRGIQGGHVGPGAANAIPTQAEASIDFRLVPDQTPAAVQRKVEAFLVNSGYIIVRQPPDLATRLAHPRIALVRWGPGYPAATIPLDAPLSRQTVALIEKALGHPIVRLPLMGGSVPLYLFQGPAHTPAIGVPIANYDDNQHAANENLRLDYLWNGIRVYAALFSGLTP